MSTKLAVSISEYSDKGRKEINQDFHGAYYPKEPLLASKGIAVAIADGISSSHVSQIASEASVAGFLDDYYCTSETWSVKRSAQQVLTATNSWLHSQSEKNEGRFDKDKGYVCTFSALILKSTTAHIFHIGDTRIYRLRGDTMVQLTTDHRLWVSEDKSYLSRGLGINPLLDIDYKSTPIEQNDIFFMASDGVYEYVSSEFIFDTITEHHQDFDLAAELIVEKAYQKGSTDNLTAQLIKVDALPNQSADELYDQLTELPFPPILEARMELDGYRILRSLHDSSRSHVYLATDIATNTPVVLKTPSIDLKGDPAYLERFLMEEWVARRINNAHVLKPDTINRKRNYLYVTMEYIEGQTLTQWMIDNPQSDVETVRNIVEQIAKGLNAFHRQEMLHQDLRPENIMIDNTGQVKIIDFGATKVAGLMEIASPIEQSHLQGTAQYTAPEYFLGENGSTQSDQFSLGVICYQMLCGKLPYGVEIAKTKTRKAQQKLYYNSVLDDDREIPVWFDDVLKKAVNINPDKRYQELSEFIYDLRQPNQAFLNKTKAPLMERSPVLFWKTISLILAVITIFLLIKLFY